MQQKSIIHNIVTLRIYSPRDTKKVFPAGSSSISTGTTETVSDVGSPAPAHLVKGVRDVGVSPSPSQILTSQSYSHRKVLSPLGNSPDTTSMAQVSCFVSLIFKEVYQIMKEKPIFSKNALSSPQRRKGVCATALRKTDSRQSVISESSGKVTQKSSLSKATFGRPQGVIAAQEWVVLS